MPASLAHRPSMARGRIKVGLFVLLFLSFAPFLSGATSWNTVSRLGMTANLVQHGRLDIGGYDQYIGDKATFAGKYYSDKAPGMSFLSIPVAFIYTKMVPIDGESIYQRRFWLLAYACALATSGLLTALAGVMLYGYVRDAAGQSESGLVAALTYALGTPTWLWAPSVFGHAAAGALLVIGFIVLDRAIQPRGAGALHHPTPLIGAGVALGAAMTVEYTSAVPVAIFLAYGGLQLWQRRQLREALSLVATVGSIAALMQLPLFVYNFAIFDSPFHNSYADATYGGGQRVGFSMPQPSLFLEILVGRFRGVIWYSPVLVLATYAVAAGLFRPEYKLRSAVCILVVGFYLTFNAGYTFWDAGESTGPRYITPIFPFLAGALGVWFAGISRGWRLAAIILLAVSILLNLASVAVNATSPKDVRFPLVDLILPSFIQGDLQQSVLQMFFGTKGLWQLMPLMAVWIVLGSLLWRWTLAAGEARRSSGDR